MSVIKLSARFRLVLLALALAAFQPSEPVAAGDSGQRPVGWFRCANCATSDPIYREDLAPSKLFKTEIYPPVIDPATETYPVPAQVPPSPHALYTSGHNIGYEAIPVDPVNTDENSYTDAGRCND